MSNKLKKENGSKKKTHTSKINHRNKTVESATTEHNSRLISKMTKPVAQKKEPEKDENGKIITKYDKKVMKRKKEAERAERIKKITVVVSIVLAVAIITGSAIGIWSNYDRIHNEYIAINDEQISQIEFDFYYSMAKESVLSQTLYGSITYETYFESYLGYDSSTSDKSQTYSSTDYTWYDYFANNTVTYMEEYKALLQAADDNGFTYEDGDTDYENFCADVSDAAETAGVSVAEYYKDTYGSHATQSNLKSYIYEYLKACAYQEQLQTDLAPSDSEIEEYYEENIDTYDTVDYRSFVFTAEDASDESSMSETLASAQAMLDAITDEASFSELCLKNATEDEASTYEDDSASLSTDVSESSLDTSLATWMFDSSRVAGDKDIIEDTDEGTYTVVYFVSRQKPDTVDDTISSSLLSESYSELISGYTDNMTVNNIKNRIAMLSE